MQGRYSSGTSIGRSSGRYADQVRLLSLAPITCGWEARAGQSVSPTRSRTPHLWLPRALACAWLLTLLLVSGLTPPVQAQSQTQNMVLEVTPGTRTTINRRGNDVTVVIRNNRSNVRDQIERLRSQAVTGLLVLSGPNQETILRMSLAPGYSLSSAESVNPPRLILSLRNREASLLANQGAGEGRAAGGARARAGSAGARASAAPSVTLTGMIGAATERLSEQALAALPLETAVERALESAEPPRRPVDLNSNVLCLGSRVMYPVPLPEENLVMEDWTPPVLGNLQGKEAELVTRGLELMAQNKGAEAEAELRKFERRYATSPHINDVRYLVVEAHFMAANNSGKTTSKLEAIERLRDQLRRNPDNYNRLRSLYLAGRIYVDLRYYHEGSTMFRDVLAGIAPDDPNRQKVLIAVGWSDYHRYSNDDALLAYRTAFSLVGPERQAQILMALSTVMAQKGWYFHLLDLLTLVRVHFPKLVNGTLYRVLLAESLYRTDRFQESREIFEKLKAELARSFPRLYEYRIGEALIVEQRFKEARKYFLAPSLETSTDKRKWQEAMQTLRNLQMDMVTDADSETRLLNNLEKLRKLRNDSPFPPIAEEVTIEFIKYYVSRNNLFDALGMLKTFLTAHSKNSHSRTMLDMVWAKVQNQLLEDYKADRYFEMLGLYERAYPVVAAAGAYESKVTYLVARTYANLGLYDRAYRTISEGFFIEGSTQMLSDESMLMLVEVQRGQKRYVEARKALAYLRSRSQDPDTLKKAILEEARLNEAEGHFADALKAYRTYTSLETDLATKIQTLTYAAAMMTQANGCTAALPILKDARELAYQVKDPKERGKVSDTFYRYGECLFAEKRYDEAATALRDAMSREPTHALVTFARYAIAKSYGATKREKDGETLLRLLADEKTRLPDDPWVRMAVEEIDQLEWRRSLNNLN